MRIAGLDLSVSRIGYAAPDGTTYSITPKAGADDGARRLYELKHSLEIVLRRDPPLPDLVVIENYSLGSPGKISLVRLGEIGGVIRERLFELDVDYVEVTPSNLKRFATGNGAADKPMMERAAYEAGATARNHDEADAFLLRRMGRAAHGLESPLLDHEIDAIANAGIKW